MLPQLAVGMQSRSSNDELHDILPSAQFAMIAPGKASCARSASRARSSRFGSLTCGSSRKIGTVARPRPVLDLLVTARPFVFRRPSATRRLGPLRAVDEAQAQARAAFPFARGDATDPDHIERANERETSDCQ